MRDDPASIAPFTVSVETADLDEAREVCGEHLYPRSMQLTDRYRPARLKARFTFFRMGSLTLGDISYGAAVSGRSDDLGSYHVNVPITGSFAAAQAGRAIHGDTGRAGVYRPEGDNVLHHASADCRLLALKVEKAALEGQLAEILDAPVRGSLRLAGGLDLSQVPGRTCAELIRLLAAEMHNPTGLAFHPIVAAPLEESLLLALLYGVGHQHQEALHQPRRGRPRHRVARAIEAIHAEPHRPYTTAALAQLAAVSPRHLRQEFHRQVGRPPMAYVRDVRLAGAHDELRGADPGETSVAEVARRWGYARPARFEARYRARYQAAPQDTLSGGRGRS